MGKSTISMVIFNSYVTNYQRVIIEIGTILLQKRFKQQGMIGNGNAANISGAMEM
jgi:hypothetical protein